MSLSASIPLTGDFSSSTKFKGHPQPDWLSYYWLTSFFDATKPPHLISERFLMDEKARFSQAMPYDDFCNFGGLDAVNSANMPSTHEFVDNQEPQDFSPFHPSHGNLATNSHAEQDSFPSYHDTMAPFINTARVYPVSFMYPQFPFPANPPTNETLPVSHQDTATYQANLYINPQFYATTMYDEQNYNTPTYHDNQLSVGYFSIEHPGSPNDSPVMQTEQYGGLQFQEMWTKDSPPPEPVRPKRVGRACQHCNKIKRKCSECWPCDTCMVDGIECIRRK